MAAKKRLTPNNNLALLSLCLFAVTLLAVSLTVRQKNSYRTVSNNDVYAGKRDPWYTDYIKCTLDPNSTDRTPPTVNITDPRDGGTIPKGDGTANVRIIAVASDNLPLTTDGVTNTQTKASFYVNGVVKDIEPYETIHNDTPFDFFWGAPNPNPGKSFSFQVKMCDAAGNEGVSPVIKVTTSR